MAWWNRNKGGETRYGNIDFKTLDIRTYKQDTFRKHFDSLPTPDRDQALEYGALFRCVTLLMNQCADLVVEGLRVVDREGKNVENQFSTHALRMIKETPNEFQSGHDFIRDISSDFLLDGNALVLVEKSNIVDRGHVRIKSLSRLNADGASIVIGDTHNGLGTSVYHARRYGSTMIEVFPVSHIAHAKIMPPPSGTAMGSSRQFFSESALHYLRRAIFIGRNSDAWVGDFFDEGARNNMVIRIPQGMTKEAQELQMKAFEKTQTNKRAPLLLFDGAEAEIISPSPQDADASQLRADSVEAVGRFYGVPAPLLNIQVTQWGSGIESLARLHYRFAARQHLNVILNALSFRMLPDGLRFEVDASQEVRGDTEAMTKFVDSMKPSPNGPATASRQEVRKAIGLTGEFADDWGFDAYAKTKQNPESDV